MRKRIMFAMLLLVAVLLLYPCLQTKAEAAAPDSITVFGQTLTSGFYLNTETMEISAQKPEVQSYAHYADGVLTLTNVVSNEADGIVALGDLTINLVGVNSMNLSGKVGINAHNDLKFIGTGSLSITTTVKCAIGVGNNIEFAQTGTVTVFSDDFNAIACNGNMTVRDGNLNVTSANQNGIRVYLKDLSITGGNVIINAGKDGIHIDRGRIAVSGGRTMVSGNCNGVYCADIGVSGGILEAVSTNTDNDAEYHAITLVDPKTAQIDIADMNHMVGWNAYLDVNPSQFTSNDRDYAALGKYIVVAGVIVPEGYYLPSGSSIPVTSYAGTSYAYCADVNNLVLHNYSFSGNHYGVSSALPLTITLEGANTLDAKGEHDGNYCVGLKMYDSLTIRGSSEDTDRLLVKSEYMWAIYDLGQLLLENCQVTALNSTTRATVLVGGELIMSSGSLHTENAGNFYALQAKRLTVCGGTLAASAMASDKPVILVTEDLQIKGGNVTVHGEHSAGIVVSEGSMKVTGGEVLVIASTNGIEICEGNLTIYSGFLRAVSTNTDNDSDYCAIKLPGISNRDCDVASELAMVGSDDYSGDNLDRAYVSELRTMDYVQIGAFIQMGGVIVRDGYSINGNGMLVKGDGGPGYAYFVFDSSGGTLTLNEYQYKGSKIGIMAEDLTIHVTGAAGSSIETGERGIDILGHLNFTGHQSLNVDVGFDTYAVHCNGGNLTLSGPDITSGSVFCWGNMYVTGGSLDVTNMKNHGIQVLNYNMTITGGEVRVTANKNGIIIGRGGLSVSGDGELLVTSGSGDNEHYALEVLEFTTADGMIACGSANSDGTNIELVDVKKLTTYDYIMVNSKPLATVSGTVTSYLADGVVTISLYKTGSKVPAYTTTVFGGNGSSAAYAISEVAPGDYTLEFSKDNHVTRTYIITVGVAGVMQSAKICPVGDTTGDGKVNMKDWNRLYEHLSEVSVLTGYELLCADVSRNGAVNLKDWNRLYSHLNEEDPLW